MQKLFFVYSRNRKKPNHRIRLQFFYTKKCLHPKILTFKVSHFLWDEFCLDPYAITLLPANIIQEVFRNRIFRELKEFSFAQFYLVIVVIFC